MIKGQRLQLRAMEREDVTRIHAFNNDMEIELAGGGDPPYPQSLARAYADFDRRAAEGGRDGANFAIETDSRTIGFCALFNVNETARVAELGIVIGDRDYHGRRYGREAIELIIEYGFNKLNLRRIFLTVNGRNERAIRAYRACGFAEEGRLREHVWSDGAYDDLVYMAIMRDFWQKRLDSE